MLSYHVGFKMHPEFRDVKIWTKIHFRVNKIWNNNYLKKLFLCGLKWIFYNIYYSTIIYSKYVLQLKYVKHI